MKGSLFYIHWNGPEAQSRIAPLLQAGWEVAVETEDGARAAPRIAEDVPDIVVISLARLPSHGRHTAAHLRDRRATRDIPIVFVDGAPEKVTLAREAVPDALFTTSEKLIGVLEGFATPGTGDTDDA